MQATPSNDPLVLVSHAGADGYSLKVGRASGDQLHLLSPQPNDPATPFLYEPIALLSNPDGSYTAAVNFDEVRDGAGPGIWGGKLISFRYDRANEQVENIMVSRLINGVIGQP